MPNVPPRFHRAMVPAALAALALTAGCSDDAQAPTAPELATTTTSNTWTARAAIPGNREGFVASAVPNAQGEWIVYVLGGRNENDPDGDTNLNGVAYNVVSNTWTGLDNSFLPGADMNGATRLDNTIYTTGGESFFGPDFHTNRTTWAYETTSGKLLQKADMAKATTSGVTGVIDNLIYVLPGFCSGESEDPGHCTTGGPQRQLYRYDPSTNKWTARPQAPHTHLNGAAAVIDHKLYVVGGSSGHRSLDVYDPVTNSWQTRASIPAGADGFWGTALLNQFYVVSQIVRSGGTVVTRLYSYDPATNTWTSRKAPPNDAAGPLVKVFLNGQPRLFLTSGHGPSYLYTP